MGDIVGRLFREFAITLSVTILLSALISLTLTPMMCARLLKQKSEQKPERFYEASERVFNRVIEFYGCTLQWVLQRQKATLLVAAATLVLTVCLYIIVPKGLFPMQDTGVIQGISDGPAKGFPLPRCSVVALGRRRSEGPCGRKLVVIYRDRRDEHDPEQRAHAN